MLSMKNSSLAATELGRTGWYSPKSLLQKTHCLTYLDTKKLHSQGLSLLDLTQSLVCTALCPVHLLKTTSGHIAVTCGSLASWS